MKIKIFYIALVLFTVSCRPKPLEITLDAAPQKLVIASQVVPDNVLGVLVTRSFPALEHNIFVSRTNNVSQGFIDQVIVENAIVTVTYAGTTDTLYAVDTIPGLYVSVSTLQIPYEKYELNVYDPVLNESVSAVSSMLKGVEFDTVYPASSLHKLNLMCLNIFFKSYYSFSVSIPWSSRNNLIKI